MTRYRWRDRQADMIRRRNPWPLRIEAAIIGGLMIAGIGLWVARLLL